MKTRTAIKNSHGLAGWLGLVIGAFVVLPMVSVAENPAETNTANEIHQLREQLAEQTRRIDRLYDALGPELAEREARAAELKKQTEEDALLKLEMVCTLTNLGLTTRAQFSPTEDVFAVVTRKGTVRIFNLQGQSLREVSLPGEKLEAFGYAPDGKRMLLGTRSGKVFLWNLAGEEPRLVFNRDEKPVCHLLWLPNPDRFLVAYNFASGRYTGFIVRLADGAPLREFSSRWQISTYQAVAVSANGKWFGALDIPDQERAGYLLNSDDGGIKAKLRDDDYPSGPLSIGIAPDNNTVAVGYAPYNLGLWDATQQKELRLVKAHSNWVTTLGFSPDSRRLISGGGDNTARIWDVATGRELGRIRVQLDGFVYVNSVGFSSDGKYVLAAAENDMVVIAQAPK